MLSPPNNEKPAMVYVSRSGECATPTAITLATRDGLATAPGSYQSKAGWLTFSSASATIYIPVMPSAQEGQGFRLNVTATGDSVGSMSRATQVAISSL